MTRLAAAKPYAVGYGKPPKAGQFQKGRSGNPSGRPRKIREDRSKAPPSAQLEDIVLAEAMRPIQLMENGAVVEMPMIQAAIRSMGVAAVKGDHRAQTTLVAMVQATQEKHDQMSQDLTVAAIEYKARWKRVIENCQRSGEPLPDPVPHPDEIIIDSRTGEVTYNGPKSDDDKAHWDRLLQGRADALEEIESLQRTLKRSKKPSDFVSRQIEINQRLADFVGAVIPDAQTRRQPGFDLERWRERTGGHEMIKAELKRARKREKAKPGKPLPASGPEP
jgi:hypothetical protein